MRTFTVVALSGLLLTAVAARADDDKPAAVPAPPASAAAKSPARKLTAEQVALRDRLRQVVAFQRQQPFNTQENTVAELLNFCTAFGCASEVHQDGPAGTKINGLTCLCWNYACAGSEPLLECDGHIAARIGYGGQATPGQFLATLALAGVEAKYPLRVGKTVRTVADLVEQEKRSCRQGADLSARLLGLSHYVTEPTWKNELGEEWSLERLVLEETARPWAAPPHGGAAAADGLELRLGTTRRAQAAHRWPLPAR